MHVLVSSLHTATIMENKCVFQKSLLSGGTLAFFKRIISKIWLSYLNAISRKLFAFSANQLRFQQSGCPICRQPFRALLQIKAVRKKSALTGNPEPQTIPEENEAAHSNDGMFAKFSYFSKFLKNWIYLPWWYYATLPRDGGVEELYGEPTVGPRPRSRREVKNGRSRAKDDAPERLGCGTVHEEVSEILQRVSIGAAWRMLLPFYPA